MSLVSKYTRKVKHWLSRHRKFQREFRRSVVDPFVPPDARDALEQEFYAAVSALKSGDFLDAAEAFVAIAAMLKSLAK